MFINFLKMDFTTLKQSWRQAGIISWLLIMQMIIIPLSLFWLIQLFDTNLAIAVLLLAALPPAVTATALVDLFKGNTTLTLLLTVLGHLILPLTLPLLLWWCMGDSLSIPLPTLITRLIMLIFMPALFAFGARRWCSRVVRYMKPHFGIVVVLLLMTLTAIAVAVGAEHLPAQLASLSWYFAFFLGISLVFHLSGWLISWRQPRATIIASVISFNYNNIALGLLLAAQLFSPQIVLYTTIYLIIWNLTLPISKLIFYWLGKAQSPTLHSSERNA